MPDHLTRLGDATRHYDVILCDIWGVLHNGATAFEPAWSALAAARRAGLAVVLLTNAPRPCDSVARQIEALGVPAEAYDRIVTSGDVTRKLIAEGPARLFFIGADRDLVLVEGTHATLVDEDTADAVLCTGLVDDETEMPEDYRSLLERLHARGLPLICANPDKAVERGSRLAYCAGALAEIYAELGGETRIAGKPFAPIYDAAMAAAQAVRGSVDPTRTLAIGDGLPTDIAGALGYGLDVVYVAGGLHARDYARADGNGIDADRLAAYLREHHAAPQFWIPHLV